MAITTQQEFIDIWTELDAAYGLLASNVSNGGDYADTTSVDATQRSFTATLAEFGAQYGFTLENADVPMGQLGLAVNFLFTQLGNEYVAYLENGGAPILDIAKDRGAADPGQAYHDNLLGNLGDGPIADRFTNPAANAANNVDIDGDSIGDLMAEPRSTEAQDFGDRPYFDGKAINENDHVDSILFDILVAGLDSSSLGLEERGKSGTDAPLDGLVFVHDTTTGVVTTFDTIQAALDAAQDGDTVLLGTGTFTESATIKSAVTIIGMGDDATIMDGTGKSSGFIIADDLGTDAEVSISGISFENYNDAGVRVLNGSTLGTLTIDESNFEYNGRHGLGIGGDDSALVDLDNVVVTNSTFTGNGKPGSSNGDGDIMFFIYEGDATLRNLIINGDNPNASDAQNAVQFRGFDGEMGTITIEDVVVNGSYSKTGFAFYRYSDGDGLTFDNVVVNAETGWNTSVNFDGVGGPIDATGVDVNGISEIVALQGRDSADLLIGAEDAVNVFVPRGGDDTMVGGNGNDVFYASPGNDVIDGGAGTDTVLFSGARQDFDITVDPATGVVTVTDTNADDGDMGSHALTDVDVMSFSDGEDETTAYTGSSVTLSETVTGTEFDTAVSYIWTVQSAGIGQQAAALQIYVAPSNRPAGTSHVVTLGSATLFGAVVNEQVVDPNNNQFDLPQDGGIVSLSLIVTGDFDANTISVLSTYADEAPLDVTASIVTTFDGSGFESDVVLGSVEVTDGETPSQGIEEAGNYSDFGNGDEFVIALGNEPITELTSNVDGNAATVTVNGVTTNIQLATDMGISDVNDPNAGLGGSLMVIESNGEISVTYVMNTPFVADGQAINPALVQGITNTAFITGTEGYSFEVELTDLNGSAQFNNVLGVYQIDETGVISNIQILFNAVNDNDAGVRTSIDDVAAGSQLGFFLIQDGADWLADVLADDADAIDSFEFVTASDATGNANGNEVLFLSVAGVRLDSPATLHSYDADLNQGGAQHVWSSAVAGEADKLRIGFEDLIGGGDADYEDVILTVTRIDDMIPV